MSLPENCYGSWSKRVELSKLYIVQLAGNIFVCKRQEHCRCVTLKKKKQRVSLNTRYAPVTLYGVTVRNSESKYNVTT